MHVCFIHKNTCIQIGINTKGMAIGIDARKLDVGCRKQIGCGIPHAMNSIPHASNSIPHVSNCLACIPVRGCVYL